MKKLFIVFLILTTNKYLYANPLIFISKSFDLNNDSKTDFKVILNNKYSIQFRDYNYDGIMDDSIILNSKFFINIKKNEIIMIKYFKEYKLKVHISENLKKFSINSISKIKLKPLYLQLKTKCTHTNDQNLSLLDVSQKMSNTVDEDISDAINTKNCNPSQSMIIKRKLREIFLDFLPNSKKSISLQNCISEVSNKDINNEDSVYHTLLNKIELIRNGFQKINITCSTEGEINCNKENIGATIPYPEEIIICSPKGQTRNFSGFFTYQILKHEILHSQNIELSDNQIDQINRCYNEVNSPYKSNIIINDSIEKISKKEVENIEFMPAKELDLLGIPAPPPKPPQQALNKELHIQEGALSTNESAKIARNANTSASSIFPNIERVSPNNPMVQYAEKTLSWADSAMNLIVPQVFAEDPNNGDVKFKESLAKSNQPRSPNEPFNGKTPTQEILANKGFKYEPKRPTFDDNTSTAFTNVIEKSNSVTSHQSNDIVTPATPNIATTPINKAITNGKSSDTGRNGNSDITESTTAPSRSNQSHRIANNLQSSNGTNQPNQVPNTLPHTSTSDDFFGYLRNHPLAKDVRVKLRDPYFRQFINQQKITFYFKDKDGKLVNFTKNNSKSKIHFVENKQGRFDEVSIKNLHQIVNYNE